MKDQIQACAKRLKLSWIREHFHEVEAVTQEEYLLKLLKPKSNNVKNEESTFY